MSAVENKGVVRRFLAALDRQDWATFERIVADEKLLGLVNNQPAVAFPDQRRTIEHLMAEGARSRSASRIAGPTPATSSASGPSANR